MQNDQRRAGMDARWASNDGGSKQRAASKFSSGEGPDDVSRPGKGHASGKRRFEAQFSAALYISDVCCCCVDGVLLMLMLATTVEVHFLLFFCENTS